MRPSRLGKRIFSMFLLKWRSDVIEARHEETLKDGDKNRLRLTDIHKIVYALATREDASNYARMVPNKEIDTNGFYPEHQVLHRLPGIRGYSGHRRPFAEGIPAADIGAPRLGVVR